MKFIRKPSRKWVLAGLCLAAAVMVVLPAGYGRRLRRSVRLVLVPLSRIGMYANVHLRSRLREMTGSSASCEDERTAAMQQQILLMQRLIEHQRSQIQTLTRWSGALEGFRCKLLPARVVGAEPLPLRDRRLVDAGSRSGVEAGDVVTTRRVLHEAPVALPERLTVLGRNYVVGLIIDCSAHAAALQLVTDRRFHMPAKIWRLVEPGQQRTIYVPAPSGGIVKRTFHHSGDSAGPQPVGGCIEVRAEGDGRQIVLRHVQADHGIRPGDILTSSDSSERLPFGLSIGRVSRVEREKKAAHFVTVFVKPLADLRGLRDVYILLPYYEAGPGGGAG